MNVSDRKRSARNGRGRRYEASTRCNNGGNSGSVEIDKLDLGSREAGGASEKDERSSPDKTGVTVLQKVPLPNRGRLNDSDTTKRESWVQPGDRGRSRDFVLGERVEEWRRKKGGEEWEEEARGRGTRSLLRSGSRR